MKRPAQTAVPESAGAALVDARVQAVHQPDDATVLLETHRSGAGVAWWLLSVRPDTARLGQTFRRAKRGGAPPVFCQWLRTRLEGARITALEAWHSQVLALRLEHVSGAAQPQAGSAEDTDPAHYLVLELNRRESNLLLLDGARCLLIALRHPTLPGRRLGPGDSYRLPETLYAWPEPPALAERYPAPDEPTARDRDAAWQAREADAALAARRTPALQMARREAKRLRRRLANLAEDQRAAEEAALWRRRGELLQIHRDALRPGMERITVPDVFEPEAPPTEIPLDPEAEPGENIERCFRRFRKMRDAAPHVQGRVADTERELACWQEVQEAIQAAQELAALEALGRELPPELARLRGPLRGEARVGRGEGGQGPQGPLRRLSADGWTILVGRSKEENDQVAFRLGRGRDWWLHVQGRPGSHVIVVSPSGAAPPPTTLREAAWLAGYYSRVRSEGQVDVDYAQRKYVRKVKGGEPGQVTYSQHKTLLVDLEDAALRQVLERVPDDVERH